MSEALQLLRQKQWRIIDQSAVGLHFSPMQSFATDDTLCASVGAGLAPATARSWVHQPSVVLGIQDSRLPHLQDGIDFLRKQGFEPIVRNSGGLAVVLDEGVLNVSLIFPEAEKGIDINRGYDAMMLLVQQMFSDFPVSIEAREIIGSYCPGSYDLSIAGKKFAGISQRRLRKGIAVQIYLCVNGSGSTRAELVREFYSLALKGENTKFVYPEVTPHVMASLEELLGTKLSIQDVMLRLLQVLKVNSDTLFSGVLNAEELDLLPGYQERIIERNDKIKAGTV